MVKKYELDRYLVFALSQRNEKYTQDILKDHVTSQIWPMNENRYYFDGKLLLREVETMTNGYIYYDSLGFKIILE